MVICYKYKKLTKENLLERVYLKNIIVESKKLYENQILLDKITKNWFSDDKSSKILSDYLGSDLSKISNEITANLNLNVGEQISPKIIEENIGISKDFNIFEFQNALRNKRHTKI